jgi:hypothetical protein
MLDVEENAPGTQSVTMMDRIKNLNDISLHWLLIASRDYKATDPRDKIFALMGVVTNLDSIGLSVDYSLPAEEVYKKLAIHSMTIWNSLLYLSSAGLKDASPDNRLPSWVPDWSHDNERRTSLAASNCFNASWTSKAVVSVSNNKEILTIRGFAIDTIYKVTNGARKLQEPDGSVIFQSEKDKAFAARLLMEKIIMEECDLVAKSAFNIPEGQQRYDAFWRTLCCDISATGDGVVRTSPRDFCSRLPSSTNVS